MITREEERELIRRFQEEGDESARAKLVASHMRFIKQLAHKYAKRVTHIEFDDLVQVGAMHLFNSIAAFDRKHDVALLTYCGQGIRQRMWKELQESRVVRIPAIAFSQEGTASQARRMCQITSADAMKGEDGTDEWIADDDSPPRRKTVESEEPAYDSADGDWDAVQQVMFLRNAELSERHRFVINKRSEGCLLEDIGKELGISRQRVQQIEADAIAALRKQAGVQTDVPAYAPKNLERLKARPTTKPPAWKSRMAERMKARRAQDQV